MNDYIEIFIPKVRCGPLILDFESYSMFKCRRWSQVNGGYFITRHPEGTLYLHKCLFFESLGLFSGSLVDHKNCNPLDNRRENLRISTKSLNSANMRKVNRSTSSNFKGVSWHIKAKKWAAYINKNRVRYHLGLFDSEIEAAKAYDKKAVEFFGNHSCININ